ncbi:hypothetical protein BIW11_02767 [Tropilaelaps mercedesae]|uniref:Uncharacterized protein n=1 Tax=Tropilaelaps mercedesae TaxID=418985 RepID=A0A1V9XXR8_9ACAR|nr:hypothetical protein BIW11_02767 [Tropilaelaps mercedesae]
MANWSPESLKSFNVTETSAIGAFGVHNPVNQPPMACWPPTPNHSMAC